MSDPSTAYQRLSALDASFLDVETRSAPLQVGAALVFDSGPLAVATGGIDFPRILAYVDAVLDRVPRYRQRLAMVPGLRHPVWVDDAHFNIEFHVRHTRLPLPGDERQLKRLVGRIFSQRLDRSRPLWEMWVVEGVGGTDERFALIAKAHHCMLDGVAGVSLLTEILRGTADERMPAPSEWHPRPAPGAARLLRDELEHRARGLGRLAEYAERARTTARGVYDIVRTGLTPAAATPLNPPAIGPHRRFDWTRLDLEEVKGIKRALGGTVNDVVLATVSGALGRFLLRRGARLGPEDAFRALVPVNLAGQRTGALGNHVSLLLARLPVDELDPARRLTRVVEATSALKASRQADGAALLEDLGDVTTSLLITEVFRIAVVQRSYNIVVTNVPGPPFPLYLLGAPMRAIYPMVPLYANQVLGIALFSYAGGLYWGCGADWQQVPDLHDFVGDLHASFDELAAAAAAAGPPNR